MKKVKIRGTSVGSSITGVDVYHTSVDPGNKVTASTVSRQSLENGFYVEVPELTTAVIVVTASPCGTTKTVTIQ